MNFGLRNRAAARGLFNPSASKDGGKPAPGAMDDKDPKDEGKKPGAEGTDDKTDASDPELDENGNPKKPEDASGKPGAVATPSAPPAAGLSGNARVKAILGAQGATAQRPLAEYLALDTEIDAVTAAEILGKVVATSAPVAPNAGGKPPLFAAMEKVANPETPAASGPGTPAEGGKEGEAALANMMATLRDHGFVAK